MFLFTTPTGPSGTSEKPASASAPATPVVEAIRTGSQRTGTDFGYLLNTAQRESSLDPDAKARTSSASGLFQFIEQTWLGVLKGTGSQHGLGPYADAITDKGGRFDVPDPQMKAQILALRNDPKVAAVMAGELTRRNAATLSSALGRAPSDGELYAAHFMGATGAADLIRAAGTNPRARAADLFPDQAATNKPIFYDRVTGQAKSVSEVHATLVAGQGKLAVPAIPQLSGDPATWLGANEPVAAPAYAPGGPAMHGLFRTEGPRGPVNQTVQRLWASRPQEQAVNAPRFFPRTASLSSTASDAPAPGLAASAPVGQPADVPLPPERPAELRKTAVPRGQPLDLTAIRRTGA
ncbi:lytic transglycosylase domain-containing protein [Alsobacter sp. R-9]